MTRTAVTIATQDSSEIISISATTIDTTLVSNGVAVAGAFNVKTGSTRVAVYNSAASAKNIILRKGGYVSSYGGGYPQAIQGDVIISIPSGATKVIMVNKNEARLKNQDGTLLIDFQTGFTGTIYVTGEASALLAGS